MISCRLSRRLRMPLITQLSVNTNNCISRCMSRELHLWRVIICQERRSWRSTKRWSKASWMLNMRVLRSLFAMLETFKILKRECLASGWKHLLLIKQPHITSLRRIDKFLLILRISSLIYTRVKKVTASLLPLSLKRMVTLQAQNLKEFSNVRDLVR